MDWSRFNENEEDEVDSFNEMLNNPIGNSTLFFAAVTVLTVLICQCFDSFNMPLFQCRLNSK